MSVITTRSGKGTALTSAEVDANFTNLNSDKAEKSITISAGTGLTGGGDLSGNRTLGLATSGVSPATYGGNNSIPTLSIDAYGRVTGAGSIVPSGTWNLSITGNAATVSSITSTQVTSALGYAPPWPTGAGASGTWGINVTGNAATVTNGVYQNQYGSFQAVFTSNINANTNRNAGVHGSYGSAATNTPTTSGLLWNATAGSDGSGDGAQIWQDYVTNNLYARQRWGGTWGSWLTILSSNNYNSYALPLAGGTMTGAITNATSGSLVIGQNGGVTRGYLYNDSNGFGFLTSAGGWGIRMPTGTNDVVMAGNTYSDASFRAPIFYDSNDTGRYVDPNGTSSFAGLTVSNTISGSINGTAANLGAANYISRTGSSGNLNTDFANTPAGTMRYQGDDANLTNSPGNTWWIYEHKRHSNASNTWGVQVAWGWEDNAHRLATRNVSGGTFSGWVYYLNSDNYNNYAPTKTGGGASGTWGINVTGNSATATALQTTRSINGVNFNGTANINIRAFTGSGNGYNTSGIELVGNGAANTVYPSIGFHQPGVFAATLRNFSGTQFGFYQQDGNYADLYVRNLLASNDSRAPTFYNINDTRYYQNFNDSHRFGSHNGWIDIGPKNSGTCHIYTDRPHFYFNQYLLYNGNRLLNQDEWINSKYLSSNGDIYGSRFYDAGNSNYWCDPASTSRMSEMTLGTGAYTYLYCTDDESSYGSKSIHANSNVIGFLGGNGGWLCYFDYLGNGNMPGTLTQGSDERLKKDWVSLPSDFVDRLAEVKSGVYSRIDLGGVRQAGASAQDMQRLLPEVVSENLDGMLTLAYGNAALVAAISLAQKVVELERRLAALES